MNFIDAAGFMMTYATSYAGLVFRGQVKAGETLLVHAAAGGVGIAAVQIGKALGARVIGTVGSDKKIDVVLKAGADKVINYRQTDFVEAVKELTNGKGADIIYDPVGGDVFDKSMRCVAWGGRVLVVGFAGGRIPSLPTNRLLLKNCSVLGVYWGSYAYNQPERVEEALTALESMYLRGLLKPVTCGVFSLDQLPAALRLIASRDSFGKVIIKINEANRNSSESKL
jgi:NADPH2:quinone reductase